MYSRSFYQLFIGPVIPVASGDSGAGSGSGMTFLRRHDGDVVILAKARIHLALLLSPDHPVKQNILDILPGIEDCQYVNKVICNAIYHPPGWHDQFAIVQNSLLPEFWHYSTAFREGIEI